MRKTIQVERRRKANSESIALNGPAARQCEIGDSLFILSYAMIDPDKETLTPALISMKPEETE